MQADRLRVAILVQQFPPEVGAGPARITEMASRWRRFGTDVTVVTGFPARAIPGRAYGERDEMYRGKLFLEESWNGLRVLRSWLYPARRPGLRDTLINNTSFMVTSAMHGLARLGRADVLIASGPPFFGFIAGAFVAAARRVPFVLELRDLWPDYLVGMKMLREGALSTRMLFAVERELLRRAKHVVVVTESFRRRIIEKGVSPERVSVIPNGVDADRYRPADETQPLEWLKRADGEFLVGYLGTFGAGQGLANIIDAAAIVEKQDSSIHIALVGDGLDRANLLSRIEHLGVKNVRIHPPIPKTDTNAFYAACDACLVPLAAVAVFQETIPSKIFEIMASERPVIASAGGEAKAIVEQSGAGFVAPPGDAPRIADTILAMRRLPRERRAEMGRVARQWVIRHYDRRALADRYLALLHDVAAGRQPFAPPDAAT